MSEQQVSKTRIVKVKARELLIHPLAQRRVVRSKVRKLQADFLLDALGVLHAVRYKNRDDKFWVIDGQHRLAATVAQGWGDYPVTVQVYLDVDDKEACDLFLKHNDRAPVATFDKYRVALSGGDPVAVGTERIVKKCGLETDRCTGEGKLLCVNELQRLYTLDGGHTLEDTLTTAVTIWGRTSDALEGRLIAGLASFLGKYNSDLDRSNLVRKLAKFPGGPRGVVGKARGLCDTTRWPMTRCVRAIIQNWYNHGRRTTALAG